MATLRRDERGEDEEGEGVRPSSFIAPVEKNVELSNGAAVVITIKSSRTREKERQRKRDKKTEVRTEGKHKA